MRLKHRFALVFSAFGLAIAAAFEIIQFQYVHRQSYESARNAYDLTSAAIVALVSDDAKSGKLNSLGLHLASIIHETGIASIVIKSANGDRILSRYDSTAALRRHLHPGIPIPKCVDGIYDVRRSVFLGKFGYGKVYISYRAEFLISHIQRIDAQIVRLGAMSLIAIALLAWLLGTWLGLRIDRLAPRLERLSTDPENFRPLKGGGKDEFSRVIAAFNSLGSRLKDETFRRRELEEERKDLMAMLVHDLKTPLTVISSGIAMIEEESPPSSKRTFQLLRLSVGRLRRMVEDILQFSRLEAVDEPIEKSPVDMAAVVRSCAKDFEIIAAEKKQSIDLALPRRSPPVVLGDSVLLRRVLDNLLYNAIEHTPPGGTVLMSIEVLGDCVKTIVADSGPGIPDEAKADIFKKFFSKTMRRHVGNVGLGLALCEKVALRHGGIIGIEDAAPHGAKFYFTLPFLKD
ncbi:MAG: sensor histidine kinase [Elusimicrobiota bacterium]